jgi:hypothetical protein
MFDTRSLFNLNADHSRTIQLLTRQPKVVHYPEHDSDLYYYKHLAFRIYSVLSGDVLTLDPIITQRLPITIDGLRSQEDIVADIIHILDNILSQSENLPLDLKVAEVKKMSNISEEHYQKSLMHITQVSNSKGILSKVTSSPNPFAACNLLTTTDEVVTGLIPYAEFMTYHTCSYPGIMKATLREVYAQIPDDPRCVAFSFNPMVSTCSDFASHGVVLTLYKKSQ